MPTTQRGRLPLSTVLSPAAQSAFVLDDLKTGSLLSLAQLCDDDCIALFTKYDVRIVKHNSVIITGSRMPNGLWSVPITPLPARPHQANAILRTDKPKRDLATYLHAAFGNPARSTLLRAIRRGHLTTVPGLTTHLISKHLPDSLATALGHQDQEAKHLRSTRRPDLSDDVDPTVPDLDLAPVLEDKSHHVFAVLMDRSELTKSYSDQTGRFPIPSSRGNNYLFVLYHHDTNSIHVHPIPNRQAASIRKAWESIHTTLRLHGHAPALHILDNECSQDLKDAFAKHNVTFQRVPPKEHRANAAKRAIRTYKNHFVATLCTVDSQFPMNEWDRLLPQTTLTLNLLRSSRIHPSLSAHASLFGNYDFNRTPIAVLGTRVVAHVAADSRTTFGQHGQVGWYVGPSPEHYRCYKCYFPDTMRERDVLKVDFFPEKIPFPRVTPEDYLKQTAEDMLHLLQHPSPSTISSPLVFGAPILNALAEVAAILGRRVATPPTPPQSLVIPPPLSPPRVPIPTFPVSPPRVLLPKPSLYSKPVVSDYNLRRHRPRLFQPTRQRPSPDAHRLQFAQSMQYDPSVAGKMFNALTGRSETIDSLLAGPDRPIWLKSLTNEWGRCTHGLTKNRSSAEIIVGNHTMIFILPHEVPAGRKVTYANFVCTMRPGKSEPYRIRMTVGGDRLDAFQDVRSPAVGITETKLHLNSTISDAHLGARYCTGDLKDFFLSSEMKIYQYMRIHRKYVTPEIMDEHHLTDAHFDSKGYCYVEIRKGMYGLKEAAVLAYDQLKAHLAPYGYAPVRYTPGLWRHTTRRTTFTLAVDDFGIKYFTQPDAAHLFSALATKYALTIDWTGSSYLGLTLDWHYNAVYVDVSMPSYVSKALNKFQHPTPKLPQHDPHKWSTPVYGQHVQYATNDASPPLDKPTTQRVQAITGTFLYYARAVDPTILPALNEIAGSQAQPTVVTGKACDHLLDYLATHPDVIIRYYASDMILYIIADAAYLVLPRARSRCAGLFLLGNRSSTDPPQPQTNGPVHVLCKTLRSVQASASEAETGGLFVTAQEAIPIITALTEMGHPQPSTGTPLETDNSTAHDILKAQVRMKRSKAFDMRYHWLKDRIAQHQFNLYWAPGRLNKADYFTKHHPPSHHALMRSQYLHRSPAVTVPPPLRGCVSPTVNLDTSPTSPSVCRPSMTDTEAHTPLTTYLINLLSSSC